MDVKEKLVELLTDSVYENVELDDGYVGYEVNNEQIADYLIANGVTVQADCKACAEATQNCIVKLQERIAELRSVHEWISVKDRLPDTAERVLVCKTWLGRVYKPVYGYYQDFPNQKGCWYILTEEGYYPQREVTHWMPLPQPPKGE